MPHGHAGKVVALAHYKPLQRTSPENKRDMVKVVTQIVPPSSLFFIPIVVKTPTNSTPCVKETVPYTELA